MEEMILEQRLLRDDCGDLPGADELAEVIRDAVRAGGEIIVTGCGTSEHAAQAVAALIRTSASTTHVQARQALDAAEEPGAPALVIAISHDGGTRATQLALEAAKHSASAAITARPDSVVAAAAGTVLATPRLDRSWCHTLAYTSAIIAGARAAGVSSDDAAHAAAILADDALIDSARSVGRKLLPVSRIVTAGVGVDLIAARELALKIEEGARVPATAHHLETLLHGHLAACDAATTRVVVFAADPGGRERRERRTALALDAVTAIGIPVTVVLPTGSELALPAGASVVGIPVTREDTLLRTLLGEALALQVLALGAIDVAGWNPDLIRRESAPYRAAAQAADGGEW
jgi:fructoselysine-6-P-deglycase FrlB-like protein